MIALLLVCWLPWSTVVFFFLMIRRPPRSTLDRSSAASDVYKRQALRRTCAAADRHHHCDPLLLHLRGGADLRSGADHCLLYTSPSPRDRTRSRMPSSA